MSEFVSAAPPSGGITWADHKDKLVIIEPLSFEPGIQTSYGVADAVKANIYVLTGPNEAEEFNEGLIFPKLLASQAKGQIGKKVVGRLTQGQQKPGQSPPWMLAEASADDLEKAKAYLANKGVTSAAAPAQQSAQAPF